MRRVIIMIATFCVLLGAQAAVALAATPRAYTGSAFQRKPFKIVYSGDGAALLAGRTRGVSGQTFGRLHWTSWGHRSARAWGGDWHDNCTPNCAQGTYFAYRANVKLYRTGFIGGRKLFTRMTVTYPATRPPYPFYQHHRSWTARLIYDAQFSTYFWKT